MCAFKSLHPIFAMFTKQIYIFLFRSTFDASNSPCFSPYCFHTMTSKKKEPQAMVLHIEHSAVKAQGVIVPATYFDSGAVESGHDTTMIWCAGILAGRSGILEADTMRRALPPNTSVQYFQPNHDDNPTRIGLVNDNGIDEGCDGQWTCVLTAPHLDSLAQTFHCFAEHYMGLGAPMRDNFFRWERPTHKFLSRRNKVGDKCWESRYTMTLQIKGLVTLPVGQFVTTMLQQHGFLQWSGTFLCDPLKLLGEKLWASCKSEEETELKWKHFEASKCKSFRAPTTPIPDTGLQGRCRSSNNSSICAPGLQGRCRRFITNETFITNSKKISQHIFTRSSRHTYSMAITLAYTEWYFAWTEHMATQAP